MHKLIILPGWCSSLGGMTVSLSLTIKGFEYWGASKHLCVLVQTGSLMEKYFQQAGQGHCLNLIQARTQKQFFRRALQWVHQQPNHWPLLLENCTASYLQSILIMAAPIIRLNRRPVYHIFRDLALSYNPVGNLARSITSACLAPHALCNSHFTAKHIRGRISGSVQAILYPPVDTERFNNRPSTDPPPKELHSILSSGGRLMLTPSRLSEPEEFNDKNLRALLPVIAQLKAIGYHYHSVVIGHDPSPGKYRTLALQEQAKHLGVADRFTILPPVFDIENYYKYADIVVALAPREPFGRTIVEAISCGVPVVGSQTGGIGETLRHFAPGWSVDPNDLDGAAKIIVGIVNNPNTPAVIDKGKKWVEAHCSLTTYASKMIGITKIGLDKSCDVIS